MAFINRFFGQAIRRRILASFVIVTLLVLIMAAATVYQLSQVRVYSEQIIPGSSHMGHLQSLGLATSTLDADLERFLVTRGADYRDSVLQDLADLNAALKGIQTDAETRERQSVQSLQEVMARLEPEVNALLETASGTSTTDINRRIVTVYADIEQVKQLQQSESANELAFITDAAAAQGQITSDVIVQTIILGVFVFLISVGASLVSDRMLRPIGELTDTATAIAAGDLSRTASVRSRNEIGTLATAFNSMTLQLRNMIGSLEQRVAERTRALATSTEVSRRLSTILDRNQLVLEVVEQMKTAFGYYHTQIYLVDPTGKSLVMAGGTGEAGAVMVARGHSIPNGKGLVGRSAETNSIVLVSDTGSDPNWLPNPLLPDTKAELAVPIAVGDQVIGVLDVQHNVTGGLTQDDADLIQSVANQVAIALQNARTYSEVREQGILTRTIIDSTPDWIFIKDQQHRYRLVNQGYATSLHLAPEDFIGKNDLELGFPEELVKGNPEKGIDGFWQDDRRVMDSGKTKIIPNDLVMIDNALHNFNTIKAPLRDAADNVWGVLAFARDITELMTLEKALSRRAAQLATVSDVSTAVAAILSPEKLLQTVVDMTKEQFSLYHAHIYLLDADGDGLTLAAGAGEVGRKMTAQGWQIPLEREQSLVARAARTRQGVIINDVRAESDFLPNELLPETRAEMAVPIIVGDKVLGVFDVQSDQPGNFSQEDASIYTTLAAQVGVAMQNARSFSQAQRQAQREQALRQITSAVRSSTDPATIMRTAVRELGNVLGRKTVIRMATAEQTEVTVGTGNTSDSPVDSSPISMAGGKA